METVVLSRDELQLMLDQAVERAVASYITAEKKERKKTAKNPQGVNYDEEIDNWIPLKKMYETMGISKQKWYRKYQKVFKHKPYAGETWVYKPSIYEFFVKDNIN
ncbi:MAG: hypothetical protein V4580_03100 [Bacteroidota bacterium]